MRLSVCIVNWNTCEELRACLSALRVHPPLNAAMEVIIVDNASADGSAAMAAREFPEASVIVNSVNRGYAAGNNRGLRQATGDCLLLLNPDVVVHEDTLTEAVKFMETHPDAGALGGRLVGPDSETQASVRGFPDPASVLWEATGLAKKFPKQFGAYRQRAFDYDKEAEVDQPMGSFLLIRREAWEQVGELDPQFPIFFNDVDWCFRAKRERGWKIFYAPSVVATHIGGSSTRQVKPLMIVESHRSLLRFYAKHSRALPIPIMILITQAVRWSERRQLQRAVLESA